jgi:carbamoyl-phosphate synthase large subunit
MIFPVKRLADLGFSIVSTAGTGEVLRRYGIDCEIVRKHFEGGADRDAVELIRSGEVGLVINTPQGPGARMDGYEIRSAAVVADIPCITTIPGAAAAVMGIEALLRGEMTVRPLQQLHEALRRAVRAEAAGGVAAGGPGLGGPGAAAGGAAAGAAGDA